MAAILKAPTAGQASAPAPLVADPSPQPAPTAAGAGPSGAAPTRSFTLPFKRLLLAIGLAATAYALALALWGDASPVAALQRLASWTGLQAAALCVLSYVLRGLRWRWWMARYQRRLGLLEGLRLYVAGYAFTPTPGNMGEALRGLWLARQPLSTAQGLAIFGAERLADLACLVLMGLPVLGWLLWQGPLASALAAGWSAAAVPALALWLAALALATLAGLLWVWRQRRRGRLPWLQEAWLCLATRPWLWFSWTFTAWSAQGLAVWLICADAGLDLSLWVAAGLYALAMVGGALSALPAGLGGTEALLTGLLVGQGASAGGALAVTVVVRVLTLWLAVALGLLCLVYSATIRKDISFR